MSTSARRRGSRAGDERIHERGALVLVATGREQLLELIDGDDEPAVGGDLRGGLLERSQRMRSGTQHGDRPPLAAGQHAGRERREQAGPQRGRLAAPGRSHDARQRGAGQPRDQLGHEPLAAEEVARVVDVERRQALERADDTTSTPPSGRCRRACSSTMLPTSSSSTAGAAPGARPRRGSAASRRRAGPTRLSSDSVLAQDRLVQPPQLRAGLDAHALDEHRPRLAVRLERVGLPAGAVQREHPLQVQRLAQRLLEHEPLELADHLAVATLGEVDARSPARRPPAAAPPAGGSRRPRTARRRRRRAAGRATGRAPRAASRAATSCSKRVTSRSSGPSRSS